MQRMYHSTSTEEDTVHSAAEIERTGYWWYPTRQEQLWIGVLVFVFQVFCLGTQFSLSISELASVPYSVEYNLPVYTYIYVSGREIWN